MLGRTGPFASVYFDSSHNAGDAARRLESQYLAIRGKLTEAGASEQVIGAVGIAVAAGPPAPGRSGRALIADAGTVLMNEPLTAPPEREIVRVSPLPFLLPLLEEREPHVPHVLVVADELSARLSAVNCYGDRIARTVDVLTDPVHRVRRGPKGHRPPRECARIALRRSIIGVSDAICTLADRVGASMILLAGDAAARAALRAILEDRYTTAARRCRTVDIDGHRDEVDAQVRAIIAEAADNRRKAVLERYHAECARPGGTATSGLAATTTALRATTVAHLLVDSATLDDREVYTGDTHTEIATAAAELTGPARVHRADEAIPAAALAGGSDIVPVTGRITLPDGVGALLRLR